VTRLGIREGFLPVTNEATLKKLDTYFIDKMGLHKITKEDTITMTFYYYDDSLR
jgi:hypothetical protein